ncbi:hypothetical protein NMY22_g13548 [Coprinellus aureogranulatus]|nr:hypothetical protein NMY22_g13548 [Coprinellus aureogranulatus]
MEPFVVDERIEEAVLDAYPCPLITQFEYIKHISCGIVESLGRERDFGIDRYRDFGIDRYRDFGIDRYREADSPNRIAHPRFYNIIRGPIVLELVHLTDVGVSALTLECARQDYTRRRFLGKIARAGSTEGQVLGDLGWQAMVEEYPRRRLKLTLSDGYTELQALELERLPFQLGVTSMGRKIRLRNVPIIAGVAYLLEENIEDMGGTVNSLDRAHQRRLYEELQKRMDEDEAEAEVRGLLNFLSTPLDTMG